jgi:hypothetical protein
MYARKLCHDTRSSWSKASPAAGYTDATVGGRTASHRSGRYSLLDANRERSSLRQQHDLKNIAACGDYASLRQICELQPSKDLAGITMIELHQAIRSTHTAAAPEP